MKTYNVQRLLHQVGSGEALNKAVGKVR